LNFPIDQIDNILVIVLEFEKYLVVLSNLILDELLELSLHGIPEGR
jgi:hypothetical protein